MLLRIVALVLTALAVSVSAATEASAAQRTFVASNGDDSNPCTLVLPCRSFAVALPATDVGGEVIVLSSAGYGPLNIDKAVSIIAPPGIYAGISALASYGVHVNVPAGQGPVILRNLTITGLSLSATNGIEYFSGDQLLLDGVSISGFSNIPPPSGGGVNVHLAAAGHLIIRNSIIEKNGAGISMDAFAGPSTPKINVSGSLFADNTNALWLLHDVKASITDSTITGGMNGIRLDSGTGAGYVECVRCAINNVSGTAVISTKTVVATSAVVMLMGSSVSENPGTAIAATFGAVVRVSDTAIAQNGIGIAVPTGGSQVVSWGNNRLIGNGTDGSFSMIVPSQ